MSDYDSLIDPEAEALLIEAAKNPNSVLFKIERPRKLSRFMARGGDLLVTSMTGLPSVEKKLLEVYREEAAFLLRLAYFELSEEASESRVKGRNFTAEADKPAKVGVREIGLMIAGLRGPLSSVPRALAELEIAERLTEIPETQLVRIPQASLRLAPSLAAESYVGIELMLSGNNEAAEGVFKSLLARPMDAGTKARHSNTLANIQLTMGKVEEGLHSYQTASVASPFNSVSAFARLWSSGINGEPAEIARAARHVDELWPRPSSDLMQLIRNMQEQRKRGIGMFARPDIRVLRKSCESVGDSSRMTLQAIPRQEDEQ